MGRRRQLAALAVIAQQPSDRAIPWRTFSEPSLSTQYQTFARIISRTQRQVLERVDVNAEVSSMTSGLRRAEARSASSVSVTLRTLRETMSGLVLDVSRTGARLFIDNAMDCSGDVLVHWLGHDVCAQVVWTRQYECGVRFTRALDDAELARIGAALGKPAEAIAAQAGDAPTTDHGPAKITPPAALSVLAIKRRP